MVSCRTAMKLALTPWILGTLGVVGACSGGNGDATIGGGPPDHADGGLGADGSPGADAGPRADAAALANDGGDSGSTVTPEASVPIDPSLRGQISIFDDTTYGGGQPEFVTGQLSASFSQIVVPGTPCVPAPTTVGPCTVGVVCSTGGQQNAAGAGAITLTGPLTPPTTLTDPGSHPYAEVDRPHISLFGDGETLQISATGGTVPAFSASLVAPTIATVVSPAMPDIESSNLLVLSGAADLTLAWTHGGAGQVGVLLAGGTGSTSTWASCAFTASAGSGTVPQAVIQTMASPGMLYVGVSNDTVVDSGGWGITINAGTWATLPDGHVALTRVSVQ
ncbi:MAG TPA: hypothetical protein VIF15_01345 [Polyangiaceae bacterium]